MHSHYLFKNPIELFASGSGNIDKVLPIAETFLIANGLKYNKFKLFKTIHPLYIASYVERLSYLRNSLLKTDSSLLWALRGGSGTTSLLNDLKTLKPVAEHTVLGFSDVTALQLMCIKLWNWTPIHGPTLNYANKGVSSDFWQPVLNFVSTGLLETIVDGLVPLNQSAQLHNRFSGKLIGGNLSLIQASIGTFWQIDAVGKIIFLEDIDEPPYRIAERLEHLKQAGIFENVHAVLFGDFTYNRDQLKHQDLITFVLKSFAIKQPIPVFSNFPVGHGIRNVPVALNHLATLSGGETGCFHQSYPSIL